MTTVAVNLTSSRFFGGPERQMLGLAAALPAQFRSIFVSFSETGLCRAFLSQAHAAGFEAIKLRCDTPHLAAALVELVYVLRTASADVLFCHGYKADVLGLLAARRLGIPVVSVSRGWTAECPRVRLYEAIDRSLLRWVDRVICVSAAQAKQVRHAGVRNDRISVIHNAICPERFKHPKPAYRDELRQMFPSPLQRIVGAAGRLSPEKGFSVLVDAASAVVRTWPATGFVLFGDGPLRESLVDRIASNGLKGKFVLAGFRSDFDCFLPQLDLMVLPSFSEGLPNVALEALAAGIPVVGTAVGGVPEVIKDGRTGCLVPPGNAQALADRIAWILGDRAARETMRTEGIRSATEHFSFAEQARAYVRIIGGLSRPPIRKCRKKKTTISRQ
jgi:glycosyltransferase involved in cell wall biosynthesis